MKLCVIPGCEQRYYGRGWCNLHWLRWRRTGDPLLVRPRTVNAGSFHKGQPAHNKGIPQSEEAKAKRRAKIVGRPLSPEHREKLLGRVPWNKGSALSIETREKIRQARAKQILASDHAEKISRALKGRPQSPEHVAKNSGPNHYRWKGGQLRSMSQRTWIKVRNQTLERDGYRCQQCGKDNRRALVAHHVIPHDEGGPDILDNLLTLCRSCHVRLHSQKSPTLRLREYAQRLTVN